MIDYLESNDMIREWGKYKIALKENPLIRPVTVEAWERCRNLGLEPDRLKFQYLSEYQLKEVLRENSNLIEIAKPYLGHLGMSLTGIPYIVALSDKNGWIIDIRGDIEEFGGKAAGIRLGASWAEKNIGNNGIGTALALQKPVFIYGKEHFGTAYGSCACIGVPIRNNGQVIGAIHVGVPNQYGHPARLHFAVVCVHSIETTILNVTSSPFGVSSDIKLSTASELIATAVHDLKNPLAVIRGLGELGKLASDNKDTRSYFERVIAQVDEMSNLVVELLSIFKPESLSPKKVNPVIQRVLQEFEPQCKSKGITIDFIADGDAYVNMSQSLFKRAVKNLITNAVQSMEKGGLIEVKTQSKEDYVIISIRDTAGGIPESIKNNLFEPFTFRRSGGTGLGLFMVYHAITNTHRGKVWFETKQGEGTTFYIKLHGVNQNEQVLFTENL